MDGSITAPFLLVNILDKYHKNPNGLGNFCAERWLRIFQQGWRRNHLFVLISFG
jgi:hypothetical protein